MPYVSMDITDEEAVKKTISEAGVNAVIHCAAWTAVDKAEECEELVRKINAGGTANIAGMCKSLDIPMMYFSTDYVFDGNGTRPWEPDDRRDPLDVYGQTKAEGETAVMTISLPRSRSLKQQGQSWRRRPIFSIRMKTRFPQILRNITSLISSRISIRICCGQTITSRIF